MLVEIEKRFTEIYLKNENVVKLWYTNGPVSALKKMTGKTFLYICNLERFLFQTKLEPIPINGLLSEIFNLKDAPFPTR
tara:strand:- start:99 stop:335 length:237 start_codon:yes stop_codon:yes gene_type:complete